MEMAERNIQEFRIHLTTSEGSQVKQLRHWSFSICLSKQKLNQERGSAQSCSENKLEIYSLYSRDTNRSNSRSYSVDLLINGKPCKMVVDNCCRLFHNDTQFVSREVCRHTLSSIKGSALDIHLRKA